MSNQQQPSLETLAELEKVMQENIATATNTGDVANYSTEEVLETEPFNSREYDAACMARSAKAEHLNFVAAIPQIGSDPISQIRSDLADVAERLEHVRLPDTRVSIQGLKIEIPFEVKDYAGKLDPKSYKKTMSLLLGPKRMAQLRKHSTKANQNNTPALWLNQAVLVETKKPYVYEIQHNLTQDVQEKLHLAPDILAKVDEFLKRFLGNYLANELKRIAKVNKLTSYALFVLLVDEVLETREAQFTPETATDSWYDEAEPEEPRPEMTALQAVQH